jgi:hypothetical protein
MFVTSASNADFRQSCMLSMRHFSQIQQYCTLTSTTVFFGGFENALSKGCGYFVVWENKNKSTIPLFLTSSSDWSSLSDNKMLAPVASTRVYLKFSIEKGVPSGKSCTWLLIPKHRRFCWHSVYKFWFIVMPLKILNTDRKLYSYWLTYRRKSVGLQLYWSLNKSNQIVYNESVASLPVFP